LIYVIFGRQEKLCYRFFSCAKFSLDW